ncbi:hypothetical protein LTR10_020639 [Elasticomyces elasticus]|uniref:Protein rds1 n=1 Tax=Exophiala sideris TaxID=1016849 RepID=A0ABR0J985_9EURO|nr:hypothetical protein LTR10_020639 [Elasticomyces elasticus]KAK5029990.1 hypothetical protein LTS07_005714 [Exophiala sideris]KAK5031570.1 hypothetical protein LTR13_007559 [Exophiala sideris]KAK5058247.1 hypothetical protein LTR69_006651 [Exophiala sideris]KAK5180177.1 hypothetical protein LTR44_007302 [Eurotiomycetes sp. CCFEE 6388]
MKSYTSILLGFGALAAAAPQVTLTPASGPVPPVRSSEVTGPTSHGPYSGPAPTVTGALSKPALAASVAPLPSATVTYNNTNGLLQAANEPVPYQPAGGVGVNGSQPYYHPLSDFDYESLTLALYQEWIELDLFHNGLAQFSAADFTAAGLTAEDRFLIEFMADQEVGHATLLSNILGVAAPKQCTYNYPYTTVREFIDFCQKLTRFGESGVYGFLGHLDSRESATLLLQSITTEARQQFAFRQMDGLFPMPVWFEVGVPQSWAWTLLAPYISSCPANNTRLAWQNFPNLTIINQPNVFKINPNLNSNSSATGSNPSNDTGIATSNACYNSTMVGSDCAPAISHNRSIPLSYPGRPVYFSWGNVNSTVGPNNSYVTARSPLADAPRYAMFVSQLNATYVPLMNISGNTAYAVQPNMSTFAGDPAANGTMFIALTSQNPYLTPFNLSLINPYVYAGPALYQAG